MTNEKIGRFLAARRKERGMTQEQLAEALGVSNRSVSRWENGKTLPDLSVMRCICQVLDIRIQELLNGQLQQEAPGPEACAALILEIANREKREKANRLNWYFLPGAVLLLTGLLTAFPYLPAGRLPLFCCSAALGVLFLLLGFYQNNLHASFTEREIHLLVEDELQIAMKDAGEMLQFTKKYQRTHKAQHMRAFQEIAGKLEDGESALFSMIADSYSVNGQPGPWHIALAVTNRRVLLCGESVRGRLSTFYTPEWFDRTDIQALECQNQKIILRLTQDTVVIRGSDLEPAARRLTRILQ